MTHAYHFFRRCMSEGIDDLSTTNSSEPGIRVLLAPVGESWMGLIAERPGNSGVSATNGIVGYLEKAAQLAGLPLQAIDWFERDSLGRIDQVTLNVEARCAKFRPWRNARPPEEQVEALLPLFGEGTEALLRQTLA